MARRRSLVAWMAGITGLLATPTMVDGQASSKACVANIPDSAMVSVAVFSIVNIVVPRDSSWKLVLRQAQALNRAAAAQVRSMLGAPATTTPSAGALVSWGDASGTLRVTIHRAGTLTFTDPEPRLSGNGSGVALLGSGVTDAISSGFKFGWPAALTSDSVVFDLELAPERDGPLFVTWDPDIDAPEPVFTVMMPPFEPVREIRPARIEYPSELRGKNVMVLITLSFMVDTAGRVEMPTVREVRPTGRADEMAAMGPYYNSLLMAVRRGLASARYQPERAGGCPRRSFVRQSFKFERSLPPPGFPVAGPPPPGSWPELRLWAGSPEA